MGGILPGSPCRVRADVVTDPPTRGCCSPARQAGGGLATAGCREAAAAGDPEALCLLAGWLSGRPGREADAVQIICFGVDAHGRTVGPDPA